MVPSTPSNPGILSVPSRFGPSSLPLTLHTRQLRDFDHKTEERAPTPVRQIAPGRRSCRAGDYLECGSQGNAPDFRSRDRSRRGRPARQQLRFDVREWLTRRL